MSVLTHLLPQRWREAPAPVGASSVYRLLLSLFFHLDSPLAPAPNVIVPSKQSKQPLTPNISAIPNFLWRGAAHGIFLIQKNFEMFPL